MQCSTVFFKTSLKAVRPGLNSQLLFFIHRNEGMRNIQFHSRSPEIPETGPKQVLILTPALRLWLRYKFIVQVRTGSSGENS